jgi:DNA-binding transcriptional ArsR family regulator
MVLGKMKLNNSEDVLRGVTLQVYRYVLKNGKPTGIREVQASLNLSSPRLASYHLNKLEEVGLVKKTSEGYVPDQIVMHDSVRLSRILVPRQFFYALFFATMLIFQLTLFRPDSFSRYFTFALLGTGAALVLSIYETRRTLKKKTI